MNERFGFVLNPCAGAGRAARLESEIERRCVARGVAHRIERTQHKGHATQLARELVERGFQHIVAVGGDGTINEVASALVGQPNVVLGVIPGGTGNDLIQIMGLRERFADEDWEVFFRCATTLMDVGRCNGQHFFNGMGLGFDAQVAAENYAKHDPSRAKRGGKGKYLWHILKTLFTYRARPMTELVDGERHATTCFMNTVAIGRRFAGKYLLTPDALADDGLLDVCAIRELPLAWRLLVFMRAPRGTHTSMKQIHAYRTAQLRLEFEEPVPFHLDGELDFAQRFEIDVIPRALRVVYNPAGPHYFKGAAP